MFGTFWKSITLTQSVVKLVGHLIIIVSRTSSGVSVNFRSFPIFWGRSISTNTSLKSKRFDLTYQQLAYFAFKLVLIHPKFWRVHIVFHWCKFWQPESFSFQLILKKSWKTTGCIYLDSFGHYNGFVTKKISFCSCKLFLPRLSFRSVRIKLTIFWKTEKKKGNRF